MKKKFYIFIAFAVAGIVLFNFLSSSGGNGEMSEWKHTIENKPGIIIDVRTMQEYEQGHLADTDLHYDFNSGEFQEKVDDLDKNKTYYLYCRTGNRSGQASEIMKEKGFESVYNIGGFDDLANAGFKTEK